VSPTGRTVAWLVIAIFAVAALALFQAILLPFVAGMAIAYFLDPVVDRVCAARIGRWRAPRGLVAIGVLVTFTLLVVALVLLVVPVLQSQISGLVRNLPDILRQLQEKLFDVVAFAETHLSEEDAERVRSAMGDQVGAILGWAGTFAAGLLGGGLAFFNFLALLFVTPIVAFYLLRDWDDIVAEVDSLLPLALAETIREQARLVDRTLAGFVRGQAMVCVVLGLGYGVSLSLVGLDYGFTIGLLAGLVSFIPYVGSLFGLVASVGLALVQFADWPWVAVVLAIFVVGQAIEGNILTPKLVGGQVGLHPVWVIFALFAGGSLFGFVGMLLALPVAAVIGVLVRFAIGRYRGSRLYLEGGVDDAGRAADPQREA